MVSQCQQQNHQPLDSQTMSDDQKWDSMFKKVVEWKVQNGMLFSAILQATAEYIQGNGNDGWIPKETPERPKLGLWAHNMRIQKRKGILSQTKQLALESIGFLWEEPVSREDDMFAEMLQIAAAYIQVQGHGWVPCHTPEFPQLGWWAQAQRSQKKAGTLSEARQLAIESIGFVWEYPTIRNTDFEIQSSPYSLDDELFQAMLQAIADYIRVQGHGWVPRQTPGFPAVGISAHYLRRMARRGQLSSSRCFALQAIGFVWEPSSCYDGFDEMVEIAAEFIQAQRHGWIPSRVDAPQFPKLGNWAHYQRTQRAKGLLSASKQAALESIGFVWELPRQIRTFEETLVLAAEYIKAQGHGWIPVRVPEDPQLGAWAHRMRTKKRRGKLSMGRQLALDRIGFSWNQSFPC